MKTRNFPARKLARQIAAQTGIPSRIVRNSPQFQAQLSITRAIRTKNTRS